MTPPGTTEDRESDAKRGKRVCLRKIENDEEKTTVAAPAKGKVEAH
jgi:hypothetical protein